MRRSALLEVSLTRRDENSLASQRARRLDVRQAISHPPGAREVDPQRRLRVEEQLGAGLATRARLRRLRMVGTEIGRVDAGAGRREQLVQPLLDRAVVGDGVEATRDSRLVRHDDHEIARAVEPADCVGGARQQLHALGLVQVSRVLDDGAVAVQKNSAAAVSHRPSVPRRRRGPWRRPDRGGWSGDRARHGQRRCGRSWVARPSVGVRPSRQPSAGQP